MNDGSAVAAASEAGSEVVVRSLFHGDSFFEQDAQCQSTHQLESRDPEEKLEEMKGLIQLLLGQRTCALSSSGPAAAASDTCFPCLDAQIEVARIICGISNSDTYRDQICASGLNKALCAVVKVCSRRCDSDGCHTLTSQTMREQLLYHCIYALSNLSALSACQVFSKFIFTVVLSIA